MSLATREPRVARARQRDVGRVDQHHARMRLRQLSVDGNSGMPFWPLRQARCSQDVRHKKNAEAGDGSAPAPPAPPALSPDLAVVQTSKGPIMTALDEFYKMGPGPSSSHTMGPMRITYDFFQRVSKLPEDQLQRATALKVHLFGSLSATGKGHGTDRASLAGLLGKAPATCPPQFLDGLAANPDEAHKVTIGPTTLNLTLKDIVFDAPKGDFPSSEHDDCEAACRQRDALRVGILLGRRRLHRVERLQAAGKGQPKYPFEHARDLRNISSTTRSPCRNCYSQMKWPSLARARKTSGSFSTRWPKSWCVALILD